MQLLKQECLTGIPLPSADTQENSTLLKRAITQLRQLPLMVMAGTITLSIPQALNLPGILRRQQLEAVKKIIASLQVLPLKAGHTAMQHLLLLLKQNMVHRRFSTTLIQTVQRQEQQTAWQQQVESLLQPEAITCVQLLQRQITTQVLIADIFHLLSERGT